MKNKILVKLWVPELDEKYDVFVPINEIVWKIKQIFKKAISDLNTINIPADIDFAIINKDSARIYTNDEIIINTDIRNGSELVVIFK